MINVGEKVRIGCTVAWEYERGGLYVLCSHLRLL